MKVLITAGGKGTRLKSLSGELPKPLMPVCGKPVLEYVIETCKSHGFCDIVLLVGYGADQIKEHFGDGSGFGVRIEYSLEEEPLGTAGCVKNAAALADDDFFLLHGDVYSELDLSLFFKFHKEKGALASIFVHGSTHPYDTDIVELNSEGRVEGVLHRPGKDERFVNLSNAGSFIFRREVMELIGEGKQNLERDLFPLLISSEKGLFGYISDDYTKDMGTPDRFAAVEKHIVVKQFVEERKGTKKAVLLDRDGTLNKEVGLVDSLDRIELLPGVAEAVKVLNGKGYLLIIVTNQPQVARGMCSIEEIEAMNARVKELAEAEGGKIIDVFYCPHHPETQHADAPYSEYRKACECRKPQAGMILEAIYRHGIDPGKSYLIGDSWRDIVAGNRAGVTTIFIGEKEGLKKRADASHYVDGVLKAALEVIE